MSDPTDTSEPTLHVTVNGDDQAVPACSTLADLVHRLGHAAEGIATALNGEFVARGRRHERALCDGDKVTCFQAIVGG